MNNFVGVHCCTAKEEKKNCLFNLIRFTVILNSIWPRLLHDLTIAGHVKSLSLFFVLRFFSIPFSFFVVVHYKHVMCMIKEQANVKRIDVSVELFGKSHLSIRRSRDSKLRQEKKIFSLNDH